MDWMTYFGITKGRMAAPKAPAGHPSAHSSPTMHHGQIHAAPHFNPDLHPHGPGGRFVSSGGPSHTANNLAHAQSIGDHSVHKIGEAANVLIHGHNLTLHESLNYLESAGYKFKRDAGGNIHRISSKDPVLHTRPSNGLADLYPLDHHLSRVAEKQNMARRMGLRTALAIHKLDPVTRAKAEASLREADTKQFHSRAIGGDYFSTSFGLAKRAAQAHKPVDGQKYDLDHVVPKAMFHLESHAAIDHLNRPSNLQWLTSNQNRVKSNGLITKDGKLAYSSLHPGDIKHMTHEALVAHRAHEQHYGHQFIPGGIQEHHIASALAEGRSRVAQLHKYGHSTKTKKIKFLFD